MTITWERLPHRAKFDLLFRQFRELGHVLIAYSGGVDSTLLMKVGTLALGDRCQGVIARSETLTPDEYRFAMAIAGDHCFNLKTIEYSELAIENYAANPSNRCYFCKHELYDQLTQVGRELGIRVIVNGDNADDAGDYRPGAKAAEEFQVVSPLRDAELGKQEIRDLARALGLANWDKPSSPCLSSRIAYGLEIDTEKLRQVSEGEKLLRRLGFRQVRVRHHGDLARIEVPAAQLEQLMQPEVREQVAAHLKSLGFKFTTVDLLGYRTGSLNAMLPEAQIQSATQANATAAHPQ
jgi:uncharacterized protein